MYCFLQFFAGIFRRFPCAFTAYERLKSPCPLWWNNMPDLCSSSNLCNRATTHTKWKKLISVHKLTQISVLIFLICLLYEDLLSKLYTHCRIQQNATMCTALLHLQRRIFHAYEWNGFLFSTTSCMYTFLS